MLVLFTGIASASIMFILLRSESGSEHDDDDDVLKQSAHGKPIPEEGNYADSDGFIHIRSIMDN